MTTDRAAHQGAKEHAVAGKFEVYQDKARRYRFRLKNDLGQVVATGEAYTTTRAATKGCEQVRRAAEGAAIVEVDL